MRLVASAPSLAQSVTSAQLLDIGLDWLLGGKHHQETVQKPLGITLIYRVYFFFLSRARS